MILALPFAIRHSLFPNVCNVGVSQAEGGSPPAAPEGQPKIAQPFRAGKCAVHRMQVPEGRQISTSMASFVGSDLPSLRDFEGDVRANPATYVLGYSEVPLPGSCALSPVVANADTRESRLQRRVQCKAAFGPG